MTAEQTAASRRPDSTNPQDWPTGRLLSAAARRVERAWDTYLAQWDLSHASVPVLVALLRGGLSQREIAAHMHVTEQSIGRVVRGLQDQGYVTRSEHSADRRRQVVTITTEGRRVLVALDRRQAVDSLMGESLSAAETETLRGLLIQMLNDSPQPPD